jgi:hypothetical protein
LCISSQDPIIDHEFHESFSVLSVHPRFFEHDSVNLIDIIAFFGFQLYPLSFRGNRGVGGDDGASYGHCFEHGARGMPSL